MVVKSVYSCFTYFWFRGLKCLCKKLVYKICISVRIFVCFSQKTTCRGVHSLTVVRWVQLSNYFPLMQDFHICNMWQIWYFSGLQLEQEWYYITSYYCLTWRKYNFTIKVQYFSECCSTYATLIFYIYPYFFCNQSAFLV